jgi:membrane protein
MARGTKHLVARFHTIKNRLLKIPAVQLIYRTAEGSGHHDAAHLAAGVAYYAFLSIFPLLLGLIALFGFFLPSVDLQERLLSYVGDNIPGATTILQQNITNIIELRGTMGFLSIVLFLWGASAMFRAVNRAINRAWDITRYRSFFIRTARELGMVLGIGILFLLSLGASAIISIVRGVVDLPAGPLIIVDAGTRLVAFLLILAVFLLLYKYIPNTRTRWRDVWLGALLASVLFEIARTLFVFYLANFTSYQLLYGSIASIIILLIWIYYSALIMVLGAEFTFQYGRMREPKTPANAAK